MAFDKTFRLAMKLGVSFALKMGKKITLSAAPFLKNGEIWIPIEACSFSFTHTEFIGGVEFGALSGIKDMYVKYDEMGLVIVDDDEVVTRINRADNLYDMTSLMSEFIYELPRVEISPAYAPATEAEIQGFKMVSNEVVKLGEGKRHPVLFANEEKFAKLRAAYLGADSSLKKYISFEVDKAETIINDGRTRLNADASDLASPFVCAYDNPEQYDIGGRMGESSNSSKMVTLAFAYRMTGKIEYAKCAYYLGRDLGAWNHWGPCHFLNAAMAMRSYATAYDWLYDAWKELGLDPLVIRSGLIKNGLDVAYRSMIDDDCDWRTANPRSTGWRFKLKKDNWNAVCNCGVLTALIALLADDEPYTDSERDRIMTTLGASLVTLTYDGHVLRQYAPDGSYVESNTYWSYGTNSLFYGVGALYSYFGTDFGITRSPGMDKTCYFAINSESADFVGWSYHDGDLSKQDTSMFNLFATVTGDSMLYAVRKMHLERGKASTLFDVLYDPAIVGADVPELTAFPLDYYMERLHGIVVRDGWNADSLYAGIMGGVNPKSGSHDHVDSGAFIYHNKGVRWITDIGKDYYNIVGGYFGNYGLYRRVAEGHNVVFIRELPCGQALGDGGSVTRVEFDGKKSFAIIDNKGAYGGYAEKALRGMLLTNGRRTTVIQDEIVFNEPCEAFSAYHYRSDEITAEISDDGLTCILTHKNGERLSLCLITENEGAGFEVTSCYDFLLSCTKSFEGEYSREDHSRLLVRYGKTDKIKSALVIELFSDASSGYTEIKPMCEW